MIHEPKSYVECPPNLPDQNPDPLTGLVVIEPRQRRAKRYTISKSINVTIKYVYAALRIQWIVAENKVDLVCNFRKYYF